jgi:hypothetical protein
MSIVQARRLLAVAVPLGVGAALLAGCGAPRPGVSNGSVSACYRAIPTARVAVHDTHATMIGVHRVPADKIRSHLPPPAQAELASEDDSQLCAVAFKGDFAAGQVDLAPLNEQGSYAVILVSSRDSRLVGSAVLTHLPPSLGKRTV